MAASSRLDDSELDQLGQGPRAQLLEPVGQRLALLVRDLEVALPGLQGLPVPGEPGEFMLVDVVILSILVYALLGKLADSIARLLERLCLAWHPAFQHR